MDTQSFQFRVEANVGFTPAEVAHLQKMSSMHYDGICKLSFVDCFLGTLCTILAQCLARLSNPSSTVTAPVNFIAIEP